VREGDKDHREDKDSNKKRKEKKSLMMMLKAKRRKTLLFLSDQADVFTAYTRQDNGISSSYSAIQL